MKIKKSTMILTALIAAQGLLSSTQAAVITAGELIVDVRNQDLGVGTNTWINHSPSANSVGDFSRSGGGAFAVVPALGDSSNIYANAILINNNGADSAKSAVATPAVIEGNNTCSVEAWVYATSISGNSTVAGWGSGGSYNMRSFRYNDNSGSGFFSGYSNDSGWGGMFLPVNQWVYLAYTWDGSSAVGYINGMQKVSAPLATMTTTHYNLYLGAGRSASDAFRGYIADMRVHTGVLSAEDVANNFAEGMVQPALAPVVVGLDDETLFKGQSITLAPVVSGGLPMALQWSSNGVAIVDATNATLSLDHVQLTQDGDVYSVVASNAWGMATNGMTLTVLPLPDTGPVTINFDINKSSANSYSGTAIAPGGGSVWNQFLATGSPPYSSTSVVDAEGNAIDGCQISIAGSSFSAWDNSSVDAGNPNPLNLMRDYIYGGPYTVTVSGLSDGEYDLYVYGHGDGAGQAATITVSTNNGGASVILTDSGEFRNIYQTNVVAEGNSYAKLAGTVSGDATFSFEVADRLNGFQLQSAAPVLRDIAEQSVFAGTALEVTPLIAGRAPFTYQWISNGVVIATTEMLTLSAIQAGQDGEEYSLIVSNPQGSATNSFVLKVFNGDYDSFRVNLQMDVNTTNVYEYAGTAISSDTGTQWIQFYEPENTSVSSVTLTNVANSQGNVTDYFITIDKVDLWNIYTATNTALGNPNPLSLMGDYMYRGPYTVTIGNLPPGEYNLYVYAHGDNAGQVSTVALDAVNGGASGITTDVGEYRNIYQDGAEGNSYLYLNATVGGSGTLRFTTSKYLNGFQLQRVAIGVGPINITAISVVGGMANISWTSDSGSGYSIESKPSLTGGAWTSVTNVSSVGSQTTAVPVSGGDQEFYRISK